MAPETTEAPVGFRSLERKALRASLWSVIEYGSATGLRVVSSLVLTRLLLPAYFGEMTLVMTMIVGITLLSDIGLAPSVIQSPRGDEPDFLNTAWTLQAARGVVLWLVGIAISWPMAVLYKDRNLEYLLPVLSFCTLLGGFNSTNLLSLSRHLGVKRLFAIDVSTSLVSLIVTILLAWYRPSVWAIVAGQVAGSIYRLALSHVHAIAPGIRNSFLWDKQSVASIGRFGRWIMVGTAFYFFASQADRLILGTRISFALLGVYGLAYSLSDMPRKIFVALGSRVFYPLIAKLIHLPRQEFRSEFLRYRKMVLMVGACLLALMVSRGGLLITKLYDRRYHEAAWMIPILAIGLWQTLLYETTFPVLFSLGKTTYNAIAQGGYCLAICAGVPIAFHYWGMRGAVFAVAFGDLPVYLVTQFGVTREGIGPLKQDLLLTGFFLSLLAFLELLIYWL
jgi:O-antigen/teichoic acid export membrane protein